MKDTDEYVWDSLDNDERAHWMEHPVTMAFARRVRIDAQECEAELLNRLQTGQIEAVSLARLGGQLHAMNLTLGRMGFRRGR